MERCYSTDFALWRKKEIQNATDKARDKAIQAGRLKKVDRANNLARPGPSPWEDWMQERIQSKNQRACAIDRVTLNNL